MDPADRRADPAMPSVDYSLARVLHPLRNKSRRRINYTTYALAITLILYALSIVFFH